MLKLQKTLVLQARIRVLEGNINRLTQNAKYTHRNEDSAVFERAIAHNEMEGEVLKQLLAERKKS